MPWYQTLSFHLVLLAGCLAMLLTAVLAWTLAALVRWRRSGLALPRGAQLARWLVGALGLTSVGLLIWLVVLLSGYGASYIFPAQTVTLITWLFWLVVLLTLAMLVLAVLAWKRRYWNTIWRAHYTLVAMAAVGLVWVLYFYNLIAPLS